jgi:hypothetical protein
MSSTVVQDQRKAEAIAAAVEAIKETKPDTERLDVALAEPLIADEHKLVALVAEMAEMVARQERTINHLGTHILAEQDTRLEKLEKAGEKGTTKKG